MTSPAPFPGYILALYGPSGVGKSTIKKLLSNVCHDIVTPVPILTTRGPKTGDDGEYVYVDPAEFAALRESGDIVASTSIPSSSEVRWYGYRGADISGAWGRRRIPVVITEFTLLQSLARHYGRRSVLSFGLLPPGESKRHRLSVLLHRLRARGRETPEQIDDRLRNAETDLATYEEYSDLFDHLIVNDDLTNAFERVKAQLRSPDPPAPAVG